MLNVMYLEIEPNADVSVVIEEIHLKCAESLVVAVTVIVQAIKLVRMLSVLIHVFMIMFVHHKPNVHHRITCQFVSVKKVLLEIHMLIVDENHKLNVRLTVNAHHD